MEKKYAAIAQSVERILGKDEVASSNLASSSIKQMSAQESGLFVLFRCNTRFERLNRNSPVDCCSRRLDGAKH